MAQKKPLVYGPNGEVQQLQPGDGIDAAQSGGDVALLTNANAGPLTFGTPVYSSGAGAVNKAKADASGTATAVGLIRDSTVAASASGAVQINGVLTGTTAQWDAVTGGSGGLTAGTRYFLSPVTAGMLTTAVPTTVGQFIQRAGIALSTTDLKVDIGPCMSL